MNGSGLNIRRMFDPARWRRVMFRCLVSTFLFAVGIACLPYCWCARDADRWFRGDTAVHRQLGEGVALWVERPLGRTDFNTGSRQFNGEWLFGTYMMAAMGYGQVALQQPSLREVSLRRMERSIDLLLSPEVRAFDREVWRTDPLETLDGTPAHGAYLGYLNLALSLHRRVDPKSKYAELNDRITSVLMRRVEQSNIGLIESYPCEVYPMDNSCVAASIGLHARATGVDRTDFLRRWSARVRAKYIDPASGLLYQAVYVADGRPLDEPRGSGTALAIYTMSFVDMKLSRELYDAARKNLLGRVIGFGGVREYPRTSPGGAGDIDSGPVVGGYGLSATGFLIAGARIHRDSEAFRWLYATAYAAGAPWRSDDRLNFVTGGPLGDAILFAMFTAADTTGDAP